MSGALKKYQNLNTGFSENLIRDANIAKAIVNQTDFEIESPKNNAAPKKILKVQKT